MAKQAAAQEKPSLFARVREFYDEVMVELRKVTWPSREELKVETQIVLMLLAIFAGVIFAYDFVFQKVVVWLLSLG